MAGEAGLDRPCAGCTSPSSTDPTPWLSGGELLLTTGLRRGRRARVRGAARRARPHGAGVRHRVLARARARDAAGNGAGARVPGVRGAVRGAVHRHHRARGLPARQRAVRGAAAGAVGARAARADRALRARAGRRGERAGDDDRRPGAHPRRARAGAGAARRARHVGRRRPPGGAARAAGRPAPVAATRPRAFRAVRSRSPSPAGTRCRRRG